jgi:hypothetical protein
MVQKFRRYSLKKLAAIFYIISAHLFYRSSKDGQLGDTAGVFCLMLQEPFFIMQATGVAYQISIGANDPMTGGLKWL